MINSTPHPIIRRIRRSHHRPPEPIKVPEREPEEDKGEKIEEGSEDPTLETAPVTEVPKAPEPEPVIEKLPEVKAIAPVAPLNPAEKPKPVKVPKEKKTR